ncbi:MAG: hypothetical protein Kow00121_39280 [Elainellaceae cyanobacterium]
MSASNPPNSNPHNSNSYNKDRYLYPRSRYYGEFTPENLVFNSNLQEFAQRISYICNLEVSGRIPPEAAYQQIKQLYKQLKQSKKELGIGTDSRTDGADDPES